MNDERTMRILKGEIATAIARSSLQSGDRLYISRCGGIKSTVTYRDDWQGCWIITASLSDVHALHVLKVNGIPRSFANETAAILNNLHPSARLALYNDCAQRIADRDEEFARLRNSPHPF